MKQKVFRALLALLLTVLLCIGMNAAAFLIDTDTMRQNAKQAMTMFTMEGASPELVGGFRSAQLDNFTAVLMVKTAAYTGPETLLQKTFAGFRTDIPAQEGQSTWDAFCTYVDGSESPTGGLSYTRYWHGYTLPLRILLCLFTAPNIQMLLLFAQTALFAAVCMLMQRRNPALLPGFVLAFFYLMPPATGICFQYAPVSLLTLTACILILALDHSIDRVIGMPAFFALTGLLTSYYDLLTYPLVTLGFPLIIHASLRLRESSAPWGRLLLEGVLCSLCWALGYGGMWLLKFVISGICYGPGLFYGALAHIRLRVSSNSDGVTYNRIEAVVRNLNVILQKPAYRALLLLGMLSALALPLHALCKAIRRRMRPRFDARVLLLLMPALLPVAWILALANHTLDHTYFTYRCLTIAVFSVLAALSHLLIPRESLPTPDTEKCP